MWGILLFSSLVVCSGILQVSGRLALYYLSIGHLLDKLHSPSMVNERNCVITEVQQGKVHAAQFNNGVLASTTLTKKRIKLIKIQSHPSMLI